ncbi:hypothetical protein Tco_0911383 [Tanacetum coccineum]|uniref:Uncharacterized protein n=1 Tax=Tanacetum coccineum TaxID=301880 RepID=A0ABQ5CYS7_9ASTR
MNLMRVIDLKKIAEKMNGAWDAELKFKNGALHYMDHIQKESLATLFYLYIYDNGIGVDCIDSGWLGRQGTALALHS